LEPKDPALAATIKSMNERGINTLYGRWLIEGAPRVLLFDTGSGYKFLNEWKADLWSIAGIPGPDGDHESNEAIVFGYLIAWFLGEVCDRPLAGCCPGDAN
jgi:glycogen(starch) synthase